MLGDFIERALSAIGVTAERVERWLGRPCGCKERKEKLNALGYWAKRTLAKIGIGDTIRESESYLNDLTEGSP